MKAYVKEDLSQTSKTKCITKYLEKKENIQTTSDTIKSE